MGSQALKRFAVIALGSTLLLCCFQNCSKGFLDQAPNSSSNLSNPVANSGANNNSNSSNTPPPSQAGQTAAFKRIASGTANICAITNQDTLKCMGWNSAGQLGIGSTQESSPSLLDVQGLSSVTTVDIGAQHICATTATGAIWCWGLNSYGQLGNNSKVNSNIPAQVTGINNALAVVSGDFHSCALTNQNTVKCWGDNSYNQLGDSTIGALSLVPVDVSGLPLAKSITAAGEDTCVLTVSSEVFCWGTNSTPTKIPNMSGVVAISLGGDSLCALTGDQKVYCASSTLVPGSTSVYTYGAYSYSNSVQVPNLTGVKNLFVGGGSSCAIHSDNSISCWKDSLDTNGQLSFTNLPSDMFATESILSPALSKTNFFQCFMTNEGHLKCWSKSYFPSGLTPDTLSSTTPVELF